MSGDFPIFPTSGSLGANGATHPSSYPITSLQNVNPSTNITPSMSFSPVFRPSTSITPSMSFSPVFCPSITTSMSFSPVFRPTTSMSFSPVFRPSTSITPSMSFSPVFRPSIPLTQREQNVPTLAIAEMGGGSRDYQQNGGLFRSDVQETQTRRRTRHTPQQIQGLQAMFKECPNPDQEQRLKLCRDLGLTPLQVKYWFQNRRNQEKVKQRRNDNAILKAENDELERDIIRLQATLLGNITDGNGSEVSTEVHQLCLENAEINKTNDKLRDTISRLGGVMDTLGRAASPIPSPSLVSDTYRISPNPITEHLDDTIMDDPAGWVFDENIIDDPAGWVFDETIMDDPEWVFDETIMDDLFSESGMEVQYAETDDGQSPEAGGPDAAGELH